ELQDYLDGNIGSTGGNGTLSLGGTNWNATATDFEDASLAIAAGPGGYVTYSAINSGADANLPDFIASATTGDNMLVGSGGIDNLDGLAGNDSLVGAGGDDILFGNAGSDLILGGAGNDAINGGADNDSLPGGLGADTFRFSGAPGNDTIV